MSEILLIYVYFGYERLVKKSIYMQNFGKLNAKRLCKLQFNEIAHLKFLSKKSELKIDQNLLWQNLIKLLDQKSYLCLSSFLHLTQKRIFSPIYSLKQSRIKRMAMIR
ncbi:hypothetical protein BpHYR1_046909 [Brachionus plicatilis]|uniref:Uncharacterized protein n=1 Tax=Brachionus plicatilis TaxID=10195 RepID=A0A3M7P620_BRAPC|nr:hypothetical protein BpHYR1_046909 [Brachionus plicatilis]